MLKYLSDVYKALRNLVLYEDKALRNLVLYEDKALASLATLFSGEN